MYDPLNKTLQESFVPFVLDPMMEVTDSYIVSLEIDPY